MIHEVSRRKRQLQPVKISSLERKQKRHRWPCLLQVSQFLCCGLVECSERTVFWLVLVLVI